MFIEKEFFIGLRDLEKGNKLSNTALLGYLEDSGGVHSNIAGYGLNDLEKVKHSWILLGWKIQLFKRPIYNRKFKSENLVKKIR